MSWKWCRFSHHMDFVSDYDNAIFSSHSIHIISGYDNAIVLSCDMDGVSSNNDNAVSGDNYHV